MHILHKKCGQNQQNRGKIRTDQPDLLLDAIENILFAISKKQPISFKIRKKAISKTKKQSHQKVKNMYRKNPFYTSTTVDIKMYKQRICQYFQCSDECYVMAMIYIDRISNLDSEINLDRKTVHKLFLTGVMIAAKFHDDIFFFNSFYSRIGGIELKELNFMEKEFLRRIGYNLFIEPELFQAYIKKMIDYGISINLHKAFSC